MKRVSGWYRLFIVFAGVWTAVSIVIFYSLLPDKEGIEKERHSDIEEVVSDFLGMQSVEKHKFLLMDKDYKELPEDEQKKLLSDIESGKVEVADFLHVKSWPSIESKYKLNLSKYHKERRGAIYFFFLCWLAPIGLAYVMGWCAGWIIRGFRKEK